MSKNKYCIRDRLKCGPIFCEITDRWLDDKGEWHYRISCDTWLSESEIEHMVFDDAVERKTGKLVECGDNQPYSCDTVYCCSRCGKGRWLYNFPHYCPNCGAEMEVDNA